MVEKMIVLKIKSIERSKSEKLFTNWVKLLIVVSIRMKLQICLKELIANKIKEG